MSDPRDLVSIWDPEIVRTLRRVPGIVRDRDRRCIHTCAPRYANEIAERALKWSEQRSEIDYVVFFAVRAARDSDDGRDGILAVCDSVKNGHELVELYLRSIGVDL